eukprot:5079691-Prymnesium_polylepis.4
MAGADVNALDQPGSALMLASQNGHLRCVERLLKAGANPDRLSSGRTPLGMSCQANHVQCVKRLLQANSTVDAGSRLWP